MIFVKSVACGCLLRVLCKTLYERAGLGHRLLLSVVLLADPWRLGSRGLGRLTLQLEGASGPHSLCVSVTLSGGTDEVDDILTDPLAILKHFVTWLL